MDKVLVMTAADNVATCLADMRAGLAIEVRVGDEVRRVTLNDDIPFGHKFALADMAAGDRVLKYGEVIGVASHAIAAGDGVHTHNVESVRARGDRAGPAS